MQLIPEHTVFETLELKERLIARSKEIVEESSKEKELMEDNPMSAEEFVFNVETLT